jgi:mxaA protein
MLLGILLLSPVAVNAAALVEQPSRHFGYFIGDVLEQRILMELDGAALELTELPTSERVGAWLQRLPSKLVSDEREQRWLELKYQLINAPTELQAVSLPALKLAVVGGTPLAIEPWSFSVAPLTPAVLPAGAGPVLMRPDRQPVLADDQLAAKRLILTILALVATLLLWLGWWLWRRSADISRLPFAQAWHQLNKLDPNRLDDDPEAWYIMHHAFNDAAGRTINRTTIPDLIRQDAWLESYQARIDEFYLASSARFFEQVVQPRPFALIELCKTLYLVEKRHSGGSRQARG